MPLSCGGGAWTCFGPAVPLCSQVIQLQSVINQTGTWSLFLPLVSKDNVCVFVLRLLGGAALQWHWLSEHQPLWEPGADPGADPGSDPLGLPGGRCGENAAGRSARVRPQQLQRKLPVQQVCVASHKANTGRVDRYWCPIRGNPTVLLKWLCYLLPPPLTSPLRAQTPLLVWRGSEGNSSQVCLLNPLI